MSGYLLEIGVYNVNVEYGELLRIYLLRFYELPTFDQLDEYDKLINVGELHIISEVLTGRISIVTDYVFCNTQPTATKIILNFLLICL